MSQRIQPGMICVYVGPEPGRMMRHRVIESVAEHVITWSQYPLGEVTTNGYSWMGDRETFCRHFKPVPQTL